MKKIATLFSLVSLSSALALAQDLETIPAERMAVAARLIQGEFAKIDKPPLKVELDIERSLGKVASRQVAFLVFLDKALTVDMLKAAKEKPITVGVMCLLGMTPVVGGKPAAEDKVRILEVAPPGQEPRKVALLLLRLKAADNKLQLDVLSTDDKPLLSLPITEINSNGAAVSVEPKDIAPPRAKLVLGILGKLQATIEVEEKK